MFDRRAAVLLVSVAWVGSAITPAGGQEPRSLTDWKADPTFAKRLGEAVVVEGYSIQPPKDYVGQELKSPPGMKMQAWGGEFRKNTTRPSMTMNIMTIPPGELEKTRSLPLEQLSDTLLAAVKKRRTNWIQEKPETGMIQGIKFVRIRWSGTASTTSRDMKGFQYVAVDGGNVIQFASQDVTPEAEEALKLSEAAVLTFKKK